MKWVYEPLPTPASQGVACCDVVNRGASYDDGKIYYNTLDNQTVAVDANSGREVWKTRVGDINKGESMTMAPLVVKGKGSDRKQWRRIRSSWLADSAGRKNWENRLESLHRRP